MRNSEASSSFNIPEWSYFPPKGTYLAVMKKNECVAKINTDDKKYIVFGRDESVDVVLDHESCSRKHAALLYHDKLEKWFIIDFGSTHGTFIGKMKLEPNKPVVLARETPFVFGASSRHYYVRTIDEDVPVIEIKPDPAVQEEKKKESKEKNKKRKSKKVGKAKLGITTLCASSKGQKPEYFDHNLIPGDFSSGRFHNLSYTYILETPEEHNAQQVMKKVLNKNKKQITFEDLNKKKVTCAPEPLYEKPTTFQSSQKEDRFNVQLPEAPRRRI